MSRSISLTAHHLPAEVRTLLDGLTAAARTEQDLKQRLDTASAESKAVIEEEYEQAATKAGVAYDALTAATRDYAPQMRQSSANAFFASVERARALITEAEAELRNAAQAVSLHASIRDGKTCVSADTDRAARSKTRQHLMRNVSGLRDVVGDLPDGIDD